VDELDGLLAGLRDRLELDQRDAKWLALLRIARRDLDARRVALFALWPGLNNLTKLYGRRWEYEDTASEVMLAALERIADYPMHRKSSPPANIVRDVQNRLHIWRQREQAADEVLGEVLELGAASTEATREDTSSSIELLRLLNKGVGCGRVTRRGARLILLHRVFDVPTRQVASVEGRRDESVRKARERAEAALAAAAPAVA
jgi:DNA-directed RNA polymerase specialized sigma24 family protein